MTSTEPGRPAIAPPGSLVVTSVRSHGLSGSYFLSSSSVAVTSYSTT